MDTDQGRPVPPGPPLIGGPVFRVSGAISGRVGCDTRDEVDHYRDRISDGGDESAQQCGRLKDRSGFSRQIVPSVLFQLLSNSDAGKVERTTQARRRMRKLDIEALK